MGLNRSFLGKQYAPQDYGVTAEAVMNYARAYNDDNPWFVADTVEQAASSPHRCSVWSLGGCRS